MRSPGLYLRHSRLCACCNADPNTFASAERDREPAPIRYANLKPHRKCNRYSVANPAPDRNHRPHADSDGDAAPNRGSQPHPQRRAAVRRSDDQAAQSHLCFVLAPPA